MRRVLRTVLIHGMILAPVIVMAQGEGITNPLKAKSIQQLVDLILDVLIKIAVPVLVMAVIWVGFLYIKAQGKPEEITKANSAFFWTVIGAGVVLGAKIISLAIQNTVKDLKV